MTFTGRSYYRVLVYYPDLVTGERINLAVIAYDDDEAHARVLKDWSRVRAFAQADDDDISILEAVAAGFSTLSPEQARDYRTSDMSHVYLTEPRASVVPAGELIERIAARMLVEPKP